VKLLSIDYLKSFILEQKCIPCFVTEEWQQLRASVREELLPKATIDLERTFINPFFCLLPHARHYHYRHKMEPVRLTDDRWYRSLLLKYSPHFQFVLRHRNARHISFAEFMNDDYFLMMLGTMLQEGCYFDIKNSRDVTRQAEYFLNLYIALEENRFQKTRKLHRNDGGGHSTDKYCAVLKVPGSDAYVISDGHHRLSALYALGRRYVTATIVGIDDFWLPGGGRYPDDREAMPQLYS
jgi:hypothetical protein